MKKMFLVVLLVFVSIGIGIFIAFSVMAKKNVVIEEVENKEQLVKKDFEKEAEQMKDERANNSEKNEKDKISYEMNVKNEENVKNEIKKQEDLEKEALIKKEELRKRDIANKKKDNKKAEEKQVVKKVKTIGKWYLVNYNNEYHELPKNASELTFSDVCKENKGVTTYCDYDDDLGKSSAEDLGEEKCDGGGKCDIGDSCLIWYDETQDNGDVEMKTATYKCE